MIGAILEAVGATAIFAVPCLTVAAVDYRNAEIERKKREAELIREEMLVLACEQAVTADRQAWKNRVKQSLASWEPIEWPDVRKPRKWGRHA